MSPGESSENFVTEGCDARWKVVTQMSNFKECVGSWSVTYKSPLCNEREEQDGDTRIGGAEGAAGGEKGWVWDILMIVNLMSPFRSASRCGRVHSRWLSSELWWPSLHRLVHLNEGNPVLWHFPLLLPLAPVSAHLEWRKPDFMTFSSICCSLGLSNRVTYIQPSTTLLRGPVNFLEKTVASHLFPRGYWMRNNQPAASAVVAHRSLLIQTFPCDAHVLRWSPFEANMEHVKFPVTEVGDRSLNGVGVVGMGRRTAMFCSDNLLKCSLITFCIKYITRYHSSIHPILRAFRFWFLDEVFLRAFIIPTPFYMVAHFRRMFETVSLTCLTVHHSAYIIYRFIEICCFF